MPGLYCALGNKMGKGLYSRYRKEEEEKPKSSGQTTWRSKRGQEEAKVEDDADAPEFSETMSDEVPTHVLEPVLTFSSFVLWNPDIPANNGCDEYVRSLGEWTKLAAEVSTAAGTSFILSPFAMVWSSLRSQGRRREQKNEQLVDRCETACNLIFPNLFSFLYAISY